MEHRIQYATTSDGTHIAYATSGAGETIISVPAPPDNHIQLEWEDAERRRGLEQVSMHRRLVRYDGRGTGLSDRNVTDFSLDARVSDLEAVVSRLGVETFALVSGSHGVQVAVAYAARHPERVTHLLTVNPFVRGSDFMTPSQLSMYEHMLVTDFRMFTDVVAAQMFGFSGEEGPRYAEYFRACVEPQTAVLIYNAMLEVDLSEDLPVLECPVLVIQPAGMKVGSESSLRNFASSIKNMRMEVVPGMMDEGTSAQLLRIFADFLGESWPEPEAPPVVQPPRREVEPEFRTVLFTDIEDHTGMMTRLGDSAGRQVLRTHEQATREALRQYGGTEVKTMGDGFLASFRSTQRALDCAVALQRQLSTNRTDLPSGFRIRVGINAGEPIEEDGDLFGSSVITASRIVGLAEGGEIFVSNVVRELVAGKGHLFSDRGLHVLRGFDEPMRVWSLGWGEA